MKISHTNLLSTMYSLTIASLLVFMAMLFVETQTVFSAPTPTLNYQGKLVDTTNVAVPDGTYNMRFWLTTSASIATTSAVWTESLTGTNRVQVTNGLFSIMLGSTSPLTSVDFNQPLYLGVEIGSTTVTAQWDGEMSPRKILGTVPAAFEADRLDGLTSTQFARTDATTSVATSSTDTLFTITQNGTGDIFNLFDGTTEVFSVLDGGKIGIGTTTPWKTLSVVGDFSLTGGFYDSASTSGTNGQILKTTGSGTQWVSTSTLNIALSDTSGILAATRGGTGLASITQNQLLVGGAGNTWSQIATSSLGLGNNTFLGLTDTLSSYTANRILYESASAVTDSANFTFDGTNFRVAGNSEVTGTATSTNLVASSTLRIVGGTSFPANPSEGTLFYSSASTSLYVYEQGKWQQDRSTASYIVAASDSQNKEKADYVADGTNDEVEINEAISAVSGNGGLVFMLAGTYNVGTSTYLDRSINLTTGVALVGEGKGTVLRLQDNMPGEVNIIEAENAGFVHVSNLSIDGNRNNQTTTYLRGIYFKTTSSSTVENVFISNVKFEAVSFYQTKNSTLRDSVIYASGQQGGGGGAVVVENYSYNNSIVNNRISSSTGTGLRIKDLSYYTSAVGNIIFGNAIDGVNIFDGGNNTLSGNTITGNLQHGIAVESSTDNVVTSNTVSENAQIGIDLRWGADRNVIANNTLYNNTAGGSDSSIRLYSVNNNLVEGNSVVDTAGTGYSILIASDSSQNTLVGNMYRGDGASSISDLALDTRYTQSDRITLGTVGIGQVGYSLLGIAGSTSIALASTTQLGSGKIFSYNTATSGEVFTLTNAGRLGIGTSSPSRLLSVAGDMILTGALYGSNNSAGTNGMVLQTTGSGVTWVATSSLGLSSGGGDGVSNWSYDGTRLTPTTTGAGIGIFGSSTIGGGTGATGLTISGGATTTGNAYFAGNVGIGSTSPAHSLSVAGDTIGLGSGVLKMSTSEVNLGTSNTIVGASGVVVGSSNAIGYGSIVLGYGNTTGLASGALILGSSNTVSWDQGIAIGSGNAITVAGGGVAIGRNITNDVSGALQIGPSDTAKITILSNGHVNLGTTTARAIFTVATSSATTTATFAQYGVGDVLNLFSAGSEVMTMTAGGYLGLGTTSPTAKFAITGTAGQTSSLFRISSSTEAILFDILADGSVDIGQGGLYYNASTNETTIENLQLGAVNFATDAGAVSWVDMIASGTPTSTVLSYSAQLDGTSVLTVYGESNGQGGVQNLRVGIGSTSPSSMLSVTGSSGSNLFSFASSTGSTLLALKADGRMMFGTTTNANIFLNGGPTSTNPLLSSNTNNVAIGNEAFSFVGTGATDNVALGYRALYGSSTVPMTGAGNFAAGYRAGMNNTSGSGNNFLGLEAGSLNTTGSNNNFLGQQSGFSNTTGSNNNFLGYNAGYTNTTGFGNNFLGAQAGTRNTTGFWNNFLGSDAGSSNTTGSYNTGIGYESLYANTRGTSSVAIGTSALYSNTSGSYSTALGDSAGYNNTTGFSNSYIGAFADTVNGAISSSTALGAGALLARSNTIVLGGTGMSAADIVTGTSTPFAKFSIQNNYGSTTALFDIATTTSAAYATSSLFRVGHDGKVGIGTSSPYATLTVVGSLGLTGALHDRTASAGTSGMVLQTTGSGVQWVATSTLGLSSGGGDGVSNWSYDGTRLTPTTTGAGIGIFGSSTIGGGTGATGLTISGGATTTGNAYFGGRIGIGTTTPSATLSVTGSGTTNLFSFASSTGSTLLALDRRGVLNFGTTINADIFLNGGATSTTVQGNGDNVAIGNQAFSYYSPGSAVYNIAIGNQALYGSSSVPMTGDYNFAAGYQVLKQNTTGTSNNGFGYWALTANTTGSNNNALGDQTLFRNTSGASNNAFGPTTLQANTTGSNNNAIGEGVLYANTTGSYNNAIGFYTNQRNTTGQYNDSIGYFAHNFNTTGSYNQALGYQAGYNVTTGTSTLFLGDEADAIVGTLMNAAAIGSHAKVRTSNSLVLGGTGVWNTDIVTGTNTPFAKFSIQNNYGSTTALFDIATTTSAAYATSSLFNVQASGNVGIGSSSPTTKLTVAGAEDTALIALGDTTNNDRASIFTGTTSPNGRVSAQIGSLFVDTVSGELYQKTGDDGGNTSWEPFTQGTTTHMAKVARAAAQSIGSGFSDVKIAFDTIEFDTGGIADITTNDRIDIKKRGKYIINGQWTVPNLDTGEFVEISIYVNGAVHIFGNNESEGANYSVPVETTTILELDPGDYIEMYVRHLEGASQNTFTTDVGMPRLSVIELAPNGGGADTLYTDAGSDTYLTSTSDNLLVGSSTNAASAKFAITQQNASDIVNIFDGTTEVFTILDGGNVGIGSSSPSRSLTVAGDAYFGYASSTGMSGTNLNFTNATSTNIAATGSFKIGSDVITDITGTNLSVTNGTLSAAGDGISNWLYNGSRLSPSTTVGIGIFASSTIGGGTGSTGLTISGGATTTGNAYFGGRIGIGTTTPSATLSLVGSGTLNLFNFASSTGSSLLALDRRGALNFGVAGTDANIYINGGSTSTRANNSISNVAIGNEAFSFISAGGDGATDNIAMGYQALYGSSSVLMTGDGNTAFGYQALLRNTTGSFNNALGVTALVRNTIGAGNNAFGYQTLLYNVSGSYNNALGYQALASSLGSSNNALGYQAMLNNTAGSFNNALGQEALKNNTIGTENNAFGYQSLFTNANGVGNNALGTFALYYNTSGSYNTAIGFNALAFNTAGTSSVAIGPYALTNNTVGASSTALGARAGYTNSIGNNNTYLGDESDSIVANLSNVTALGSHAKVRTSNSLVLGGTGIWSTNIVTGTNTPFAKFSIQNNYGSTTALFDIATTTSAAYATSSLFRVGHDGRVSIGSTTPESLLLTLQKTGITGSGINGIKEYLQFTNSTASAVYYGDAAYIVNAPTATSTLVGKIIRIDDSTALGNTVRGLEVQAHRGTNTKGENTGINAFGRTFGIKGTTEGDAGDTYAPAGVYAESRGTTQGNALRAYSGSLTTAALVSLFHDTSAFTGTGLLMNFGNAGGSFAATTSAKFIDLQVGGTSKFFVAANGSTTIGDGTINAGLIIPRGGICVDNDGSCVSTTTGEIRSVTSALGNSDLAEMYFSSDALETGEIVSLAGGLSINRTDDTNNTLIIGVVSTKPGLTLGFDDTSLTHGEVAYPVALKGRVPIRLSTENGPIVKGDRISLSSIPGIGMKATESDTIVGIALEDYDGERAYSEGFLNQFGDDLVKVKITERNRNTDTRTQDGCYFGGGVEEGEEECDPLAVKTIKPKVITIDERTEVLAVLADESAEVAKTPDGETVTLGQALMFVQLEEHIAGKDMDVLTALNATSTLLNGNGEETLFDRLKALAQGFVDGVLRVAGIRTDELCIGETCVDEATLKALLRDHADTSSSPPPTPPDPSDDEEVEDLAVETPPSETIQEEDTEGVAPQDEEPTNETEEEIVVEEETPTPPEEPAADPEPTPTPESTPTE